MTPPYSVILPALDEEKGIAATIDRLHALVPRPEIIVVDDGSTDLTAEVAGFRGAKLVRHPEPGGYGRSLKDGIAAASNEIIAIADADGTYPVEKIPGFVAELEKGYDMVVGSRHGRHYRGSLFKMPARLVFKWLVEFTTGRRIPDINSGLRVFRKSTVEQYFGDLCNGFSFTTTLTLIYMLSGKFVRYIPIDYGARIGKTKVRFIRDSLRTLQYIVEVIAAYNPLKLFVLLSGILGLLFVFSFLDYFLAVEIVPLNLLLSAAFLIGTFVVFGMGILAHIRVRAQGRREN